ncbi:MAG: GNAT family N-acetyltransferase [Vicinamibacteria bacterium]
MFCAVVQEDTTLSMIELRDAESVFALIDSSRPYLRQWLPWVGSSRTVEDTRSFIAACLSQHAANQGFQCVIRHRGEVAGVVGFRSVDWANRRTEIGYWLGEEYQGCGIMTACCVALTDFAFREYGLNRVEIHVATSNSKSRAVPERLGFVLEGVLREAERVNDRFVDGAVYSMLRSEWEAREGLSRKERGAR